MAATNALTAEELPLAGDSLTVKLGRLSYRLVRIGAGPRD
jgi:hypothetical protein